MPNDAALANYLRVLADPFTPVRDTQGRLLGCVPRVDDSAISVGSSPLAISAQVCVMVTDPNEIALLPNFVSWDDQQADLAIPAAPDNSDLAEGV